MSNGADQKWGGVKIICSMSPKEWEVNMNFETVSSNPTTFLFSIYHTLVALSKRCQRKKLKHNLPTAHSVPLSNYIEDVIKSEILGLRKGVLSGKEVVIVSPWALSSIMTTLFSLHLYFQELPWLPWLTKRDDGVKFPVYPGTMPCTFLIKSAIQMFKILSQLSKSPCLLKHLNPWIPWAFSHPSWVTV